MTTDEPLMTHDCIPHQVREDGDGTIHVVGLREVRSRLSALDCTIHVVGLREVRSRLSALDCM